MGTDQKIHCLYDALVPVKELKPSPHNTNSHSREQIDLLAKVLSYQGFRYPIKVSKQSGLITSGHGRLMAAKQLKWKQVPVNYQDYESEDQENADVISDNSVATLSKLDLSLINASIGDFGPDFDLELLALPEFTLDPPDIEEEPKQKEFKYFECPHCHEVCEKDQLIKVTPPRKAYE